MKTLDELKTDRDVFEFIRDHLLKQGERSLMDNELTCAYLGTEGKKCAVGVLIREDIYHSSIEEKPVNHSLLRSAVTKSVPNWIINTDMLGELQFIHDDSSNHDWEWSLKEFEIDKLEGVNYVPTKEDEDVRDYSN
jgi:hypothetical protein